MATRRKNKSSTSTTAASSKKRARKSVDLAYFDSGNDDEHIESSDDDNEKKDETSSKEESESEEENLDVKKVRLAREYLQKLDAAAGSSDEGDSEGDDDGDNDQDAVSRKLQRDRLEREGNLEVELADKLQHNVTAFQKMIVEKRPVLLPQEQAAQAWVDAGYVTLLSGHDLTPTCVALSAGTKAVSGSKDHSVILWDIEKQSRITNLCPRWTKKAKQDSSAAARTAGQVLSVACSDDGRYAVVGKRDATVSIFDIRAGRNNVVKTFQGHKGPVTSLAFRSQSHQLFSASEDRCIRHYNLNEMLYLETLYGHQLGVTGIDCHRRERPISVGRDRTARAWKLAEDSHLIFRGGARVQAADAVTVIKDDWFVTGHEDGVVSLWMADKKKAVASIEQAHTKAVVTVRAIKGSDVVASGSSDGLLRFWKVQTGRTAKERGIEPLCQIPVHGFVNDIAFGPNARFCVAAIGQEHRMGRWEQIPRAKNRIAIIQLQPTVDDNGGAEADDSSSSEDEAPGSGIDFEALD